MEPIITLQNVSLSFKQRQSFFRHKFHDALKRVSFSLQRGETLGIIGRNGCGKSTVLKVISGIFNPDAGEVRKSDDLSVSLLTLSAGFELELSGRDNAIISSMLLGHSKKTAILNLPKIAAFSELGGAFDEQVKTYSSGMKARLGFSVAITMHADVLLVDEVLGVGDANFKKKAEAAIVDKISSDQTVVFVSHSLGQVDRLCNRVVWMEMGEIKMIGESADVLKAYTVFNKSLRDKQALTIN